MDDGFCGLFSRVLPFGNVLLLFFSFLMMGWDMMHVRARARACVWESVVGEKVVVSLFGFFDCFSSPPTNQPNSSFFTTKHSLRSTQSTANVIRVQIWPPRVLKLAYLLIILRCLVDGVPSIVTWLGNDHS